MYFWFVLLSPIALIIQSLFGLGMIQYLATILLIIFLYNKNIINNIFVVVSITIFLVQFIVFKSYYPKYFNIVTTIRWLFFTLNAYLFSKANIIIEMREFLKGKNKIIFFIGIICLIVEVISIFTGGMKINWEGKAFYSVFSSAHNNSYFLVLIQFIFMYLMIKENKIIKKNLYNFLCLISIFLNMLTAARTSSLIAVAAYSIFIIKYCKKNKITAIFTVVLAILFSTIVIGYGLIDFNNIPLLKKFLRQERVGNMLSSRDRIWLSQIKYFFGYYNILQMFFGTYFGISVLINSLLMGESIWAHNDILEILVSVGIIGVVLYIYPFISYIRKYKLYLFTLIMLLFSCWNGLMNYVQLSIFMPVILIFYIDSNEYFSKYGGKVKVDEKDKT